MNAITGALEYKVANAIVNEAKKLGKEAVQGFAHKPAHASPHPSVASIRNQRNSARRQQTATGKAHVTLQGAGNQMPAVTASHNLQALVPRAAPLAQARTTRNRAPGFSMRANGDIVVTHREYVTELLPTQNFSGSSDYKVIYTSPVHPTRPYMFPWLSGIATSYDEYMFEKLDFEYYTDTNATRSGALYMGLVLNANDPAPGNRQELMNVDGAVRSPIWTGCACSAGKRNLQENVGFRPTYAADEGNLMMNASGRLYISIANVDASDISVLGDLFVDYTVVLRKPVPGISRALSQRYASYYAPALTSHTTVTNWNGGFTVNDQTGGLVIGNSASGGGTSDGIQIRGLGTYMLLFSFAAPTGFFVPLALPASPPTVLPAGADAVTVKEITSSYATTAMARYRFVVHCANSTYSTLHFSLPAALTVAGSGGYSVELRVIPVPDDAVF